MTITTISQARQALADLDSFLATLGQGGRPPAAEAPATGQPAPVDDASPFFADYGKFYDFLRSNRMLGPKISATEFSGCDSIIRACAVERWPVSYVAYALATAYHETAHTMQPVNENGGAAYFTRMYDINGARPSVARTLGNTTPGDGVRYHGRGYVQLTGKTNYARGTRALAALGVTADLVANPERALEPMIAALVMTSGMEEGWFTGRKLSDDLPATGPATLQQFRASRDIINGSDRALDIASYAVDFQSGLIAGGYRIAA